MGSASGVVGRHTATRPDWRDRTFSQVSDKTPTNYYSNYRTYYRRPRTRGVGDGTQPYGDTANWEVGVRTRRGTPSASRTRQRKCDETRDGRGTPRGRDCRRRAGRCARRESRLQGVRLRGHRTMRPHRRRAVGTRSEQRAASERAPLECAAVSARRPNGGVRRAGKRDRGFEDALPRASSWKRKSKATWRCNRPRGRLALGLARCRLSDCCSESYESVRIHPEARI